MLASGNGHRAPESPGRSANQGAFERLVVVLADERTSDAADQNVTSRFRLKNLRSGRCNQPGHAGERKQKSFHTGAMTPASGKKYAVSIFFQKSGNLIART